MPGVRGIRPKEGSSPSSNFSAEWTLSFPADRARLEHVKTTITGQPRKATEILGLPPTPAPNRQPALHREPSRGLGHQRLDQAPGVGSNKGKQPRSARFRGDHEQHATRFPER